MKFAINGKYTYVTITRTLIVLRKNIAVTRKKEKKKEEKKQSAKVWSVWRQDVPSVKISLASGFLR